MRARDRTNLQGRSILVVDDEAGIVDVLSAVLQDVHCRVAGAGDGEEALVQLRASVPDLVVLDLEMPVLDGAETLRAIRKDPRLVTLPVILMSGLPETTIKRRGRGYDAFLRKPFSLEELLQTIEALLGHGSAKPASSRVKARKKKHR